MKDLSNQMFEAHKFMSTNGANAVPQTNGDPPTKRIKIGLSPAQRLALTGMESPSVKQVINAAYEKAGAVQNDAGNWSASAEQRKRFAAIIGGNTGNSGPLLGYPKNRAAAEASFKASQQGETPTGRESINAASLFEEEDVNGRKGGQ